MSDTRTKRIRNHTLLLQYALRAIESSNRMREALDHMVRILAEEQSAEMPAMLVELDTPMPFAPMMPRTSQKPTLAEHPALNSERFMAVCRSHLAEVRTEADRQALRDLIARVHEEGVINEATARELLEEIK